MKLYYFQGGDIPCYRIISGSLDIVITLYVNGDFFIGQKKTEYTCSLDILMCRYFIPYAEDNKTLEDLYLFLEQNNCTKALEILLERFGMFV